MFILPYLLLSPLMVNTCEKESELKLNYLEDLIDANFENSRSYKLPKDNSEFFGNASDSDVPIEYGTFDFIVVGAGSSGSIVSSRLSEVEKWKILLLEAGNFDDNLTEFPYLYHLLQFSKRNWGYFSTPQKYGCFGSKNRQCPYPRGKVLGGTGSINGVVFTRGNRGDYDEWATLGNPGWSYYDLLPYFKKMENVQSDNINHRFRGFGGPLNVAYKENDRNLSAIISSESYLGVGYIEDYNAKDQIGISKLQKSIKCGKRASGATAFVRPSMKRHNFNLTLQALVTKVIIDKSTKTAKGVEFMKDGRKYKALASKEVIISGGAINSPQLLMLSGVGPADELQKHNIPIIQVLPVGQHLKEHPGFRAYYRSNQTLPKQSFRNLLKQFLQGKGILTSPSNSLTFTYINSKNKTSTVPNLELVLIGNTPVPKRIPEVTNYIPEVENYYKNVNDQTDYRFDVLILHPKSVGTIKLQSKDPRHFPLIDLALFQAEEDLQLTYEAAKIFESFEQTSYGRQLNLTRLDFKFCDEFERNSKQYWYCAIRNIGLPAYHTSSSVKMGPLQDPSAVVDYKLKVYGMKKLRVADCSVLPTTISGHTNSACFVVGERASDWIKADYGIPIISRN